MKSKDISLADISRFRAEQMGVAMIIVVLFHVALPRSDAFFGLRRMGNLGVDIFLFLSGMGLWFSWMKTTVSVAPFLKKWKDFYWRRLVRVYPAWLVAASLYYIPRFMAHEPHTMAQWIDLILDIAVNWNFWTRDELTFWYIPATMMLYVFAAPYMELIRKHPVCRWLVAGMMMWCVAVQYVTPIHTAVGHIEIFWSRVPIFFLGINIAESVRRKETIEGSAIWLVALLFVFSLATCVWLEQYKHGRFPLFLERMLYIPLAVTMILLLNKLFCHTPQWLKRGAAFIGTISLEMYLIHVEFVMRPVERYHLGYWRTFFIVMAISVPLAWLLHKAMAKVQKIIP
ncbi:MAG: acyltransferase [Bacteroidales bacterium]|nr:acyltransferase [Bacteroidales bacterium]MCM1146913.1 acyltransferase [Bacteroidales bacterium]MCM1205589.1 acyltransferase [Bacillota bacterium]MCM1510300.1 acyltransferase [Clostridium sp.]